MNNVQKRDTELQVNTENVVSVSDSGGKTMLWNEEELFA